MVFISIPLVRINKFRGVNYRSFKKAFQMKFLDKLYSQYYQNKLISKYVPSLFIFSLLKNRFILRALYDNILDADKLRKIKKGI